MKSIKKAVEELFEDSLDYSLKRTQPENSFEIMEIIPADSQLPLGHIVVAQGKGRRNYFDFMVIYTNQAIKHIEILQYRSSHGYQITSSSWLKDFIGIKAGETVRIGNQVDAISGATLSSHGLLKTLNKINKINF